MLFLKAGLSDDTDITAWEVLDAFRGRTYVSPHLFLRTSLQEKVLVGHISEFLVMKTCSSY